MPTNEEVLNTIKAKAIRIETDAKSIRQLVDGLLDDEDSSSSSDSSLSVSSQSSLSVSSQSSLSVSSQSSSQSSLSSASAHHPPSTGVVPTPLGAIQTVRDGEATDPSVWDGGVVPDSTTAFVVRHDLTLNAGNEFHGGYGIVRPDGWLKTLKGSVFHSHGSLAIEGKFHKTDSLLEFYQLNDRLNVGNVLPGFPRPPQEHPDFPDYVSRDVGLWVFGEFKAKGNKSTPYVPCVPRGTWKKMAGYWGDRWGVEENPDVQLGIADVVFEPQDWRIGDTIFVARVHRKGRDPHVRYFLTTLSGINGKLVTLANPFTTTAKRRNGTEVVTHLLNFSHSCRINSALVTKTNDSHRAHCLFFHGSHIHVEGVEFRNLGPKGKPQGMGRYPWHFHHGKAHHDDGIKFWSVWSPDSPSNRIGVLHRTNGQTVTDGCFFNHHGHGVMMEEQNEQGHTLSRIFGSTGIDVQSADKLPLFRDTDDGKHRPQSELFNANELPGAHQFWLFDGPIANKNTFGELIGHGGGQMGVLFDRADQSGPAPVFSNTLSIVNDGGPWGSMRNILVNPVVFMAEDGTRVDASGFSDSERKANVATQKIVNPHFTVWNHHTNDYTSGQLARVEGGSGAGEELDVFNSSSGSGRWFYQYKFEADNLIRPVFQHAFVTGFQECEFKVKVGGTGWTHDSPYIFTTPLIRLIDCIGTINGRTVAPREFFVPRDTATYMGWDVTHENSAWSRLNFEPEPMGFVRITAETMEKWKTVAPFPRVWSIRGLNVAVPPQSKWALQYHEVMKSGVLADAPFFSSGEGILPGRYLVRLQGMVDFEKEVEVKAGETEWV